MILPDAIVPVPEAIAQRAWECAVDLAQGELPGIEFVVVRSLLLRVARVGPERLTWAQCGELFRVHRRVVGRRV